MAERAEERAKSQTRIGHSSTFPSSNAPLVAAGLHALPQASAATGQWKQPPPASMLQDIR
eukprot:1160224-Pelagomonas_calceolata.AAC.3